MKEAVNQMCKERELTVAEKGKHFDGSRMEEGEGIAWNQKKYRAMINQKEPSYLVECFQAVMEAREKPYPGTPSSQPWSDPDGTSTGPTAGNTLHLKIKTTGRSGIPTCPGPSP